jgi:hypothetical protein
LTGARPLIKDPLAFFSAEWLAANFDMEVVVMIRHPAAFASSIKSKNWKHPFDHFLKQPLLMERYLSPFASRIKKFAQEEQDIIDQAALLWIMIHSTILRYKEQYPEWIFVRHEDLSRDPMTGFEKLYDRLDLAYDEDASIVIKEHSSPSKEIGISHRKTYKNLERDSAANIWSWKTRLAPTEVQRIKAQVQEVSREFYSDDDW